MPNHPLPQPGFPVAPDSRDLCVSRAGAASAGELAEWRLSVDTSQAPPVDVCGPGEEAAVNPTSYVVESRSSVVLVAR